MEGKYIEAIEQILAKNIFEHGLFQIAVRGGYDAHLNMHGLPASETPEFLVLQNLQQLGLETQIHVADFIQKQRAAVCQFENTGLALIGSGESAAFIAK